MQHRHRILVGAFGAPGHAFPAIALARVLHRRGHEVMVETWAKWQPHVENEGMGFAASPEYQVFPTRGQPLKPYAAAVKAARVSQELIRKFKPDAVIADILTLAPALAAEMEGARWGTLVPHVYPPGAPGLPVYGMGMKPPRTLLGRALWRFFNRASDMGLRRGRRELNDSRRRLGLLPIDRFFGGISPGLCLVGTFPQLEYPRTWPPNTHVTGPLLWAPPSDEAQVPAGDDPLVVVAPSTTHDPRQRLLRASCEGLANQPVRVLAVASSLPAGNDLPQEGNDTSRPGNDNPRAGNDLPQAANINYVEWISYERVMPHARVVICHAGHGTLAWALSSGTAVLASAAAGDMGENAARLVWSGAGVRVRRRLVSPRTVRRAVTRLLSDPRYLDRATRFREWSNKRCGAQRAAELVEDFASATQ